MDQPPRSQEQTHRTRTGLRIVDHAWLLMVSQQVLSEVYRPRTEMVPAAVWLLPSPSHQARLSLSGAATVDRILSVSNSSRECALAATPRSTAYMADKMLIDASHAEETRVVVVRGNRIEEFDFEIAAQEADPRQHLSGEGHARRTLASGGLRRLRRQSPRLSGLRRNPSRLLPDPARGSAGALAGRSRGTSPRRRFRAGRPRPQPGARGMAGFFRPDRGRCTAAGDRSLAGREARAGDSG